MSDVVMPRLSDSMTEGTVVRWLKMPGETVRRGEPLAEIETDKATITYEADRDGILTLHAVAEGQTVPVGTPIAYIEPVGAAAGPPPLPLEPPQPMAPQQQPPPLPLEQQPPPLPMESTQPPPLPVQPPPQQQQPAPPPLQIEPEPAAEFYQQPTGEFAPVEQPGGRVKASPIARRLAGKLGIDIAMVAGSGPGGRVVKEDVEAAADAAARARAAHAEPTQAPAPPMPETEYAYEPGGFEHQEDIQFEEAVPLPPEEEQILPPETQEFEPPLIPNYPPPPAPAPSPPQPAYGQQPPGFTPQMPGYPQQPGWPQAPQQFPSPPPFVQGMTGNFPAMPQQPQMPPQQYPPQGAPQQTPPQPGEATATRGHSTPIEPTNAQQTVARRMAESKATAPEFFVETEVDMTTCVAYREQLRSMVSPLPSFNDFVIKAAGQALRQYPNVNAAYKDGHFEQYSDVNVGIVVSATEVLAVPTVFNVDQKGLAQIAAESQQLSEAVRTRTIQPSQMSGGTFSVSNLGMYGVDRFTAILNPPQAAILAVGAINRRAVIAEDGMSLVIRQIMNMTLTCDHRILYGAEAAEFLGAIKAWLESPQLLQV